MEMVGIGYHQSFNLSSTDSFLQALVNIDIDRNGAPDYVIGGESDSSVIAINELSGVSILPDEMITTGYDNVQVKVVNPIGLIISRQLETVASSDYWSLFVDTLNDLLDDQAYDYNLQYGEYEIIFKKKAGVLESAYCGIGIGIDGSRERMCFLNYPVPPDGDSIVFYFDVEETSSIHPANGYPTNKEPIFEWGSSASQGLLSGLQSELYHFQLDRYYDFRAPIYDDSTLLSPTFTVSTPLGVDSVFYWRVRSKDGGVWSEFSHPFAAYVTESCCLGRRGNVDSDPNDQVSANDILYIIQYLFQSGPEPSCTEEADVNSDGIVGANDILYLINYLFKSGPAPVTCP
ncbi:MAG: hypothetical protein GXO93_04255 [FCB group bacterium]|nr:hypothetical protein [FCB group bacterium]